MLDAGEPSGVANVNLKPNEMQGMKGTTRLGDTQVARMENLKDGKPLGLNRLKELSAECEEASKPATWRDRLTVPASPPPHGRNMVVGISGGAVAGVLACVLALNFIRNSVDNRIPKQIPPRQEVSQAVTTTDVKAQETLEKKSAGEKHADSGDFLTPEGRVALPGESVPTTRLKSRLDPEVLFRLELSLEQAARIRTILDRCSKDLPFAEAQIRGLLTEEQRRQWKSIAP